MSFAKRHFEEQEERDREARRMAVATKLNELCQLCGDTLEPEEFG